MQNFELIKFVNGEINIDVSVSPEENTVWLTKEQISVLFDRDRSVISRHINNIYREQELDKKTSVHFLHITKNDSNPNYWPPEYYNLDVIISVGYRVNSRNGVVFRRWASEILKDYLLKGYAINERRLTALNKTIELQSRIIATAYEIEASDVLKVVNSYVDAFTLLDNYDHQSVPVCVFRREIALNRTH